jgi:hypothetical protein
VQTISYKCGVQRVPFDGEYLRTVTIIEGDANITATEGVVDITGCATTVCACAVVGRRLEPPFLWARSRHVSTTHVVGLSPCLPCVFPSSSRVVALLRKERMEGTTAAHRSQAWVPAPHSVCAYCWRTQTTGEPWCTLLPCVTQVVPDDAQDWRCRSVLTPRRDFQAIMFEDSPMVVGGYMGLNSFSNEVRARGASS